MLISRKFNQYRCFLTILKTNVLFCFPNHLSEQVVAFVEQVIKCGQILMHNLAMLPNLAASIAIWDFILICA